MRWVLERECRIWLCMNGRTRKYLQGRFGDHYRRSGITLPPGANAREWGYIPFTEGAETTMVRHNALVDLGDPSTFLANEHPRHVYFSAGQYDTPGARSMDEKEWRASDLVFDLDADHLPGVDPAEDTYAEMLETCKDALFRLLDFIERDFGFEDWSVVFSGGRGYHVHVRDDGVRKLSRSARREIVEYVLGEPLDDLDQLSHIERVSGMGVKTSVEKKTLQTDGGWGRRVHTRLVRLADEIRELDEDEGIARLKEFDGIGEKGATNLYKAMDERYDAFEEGSLEVASKHTKTLARLLFERTLREESAPIDEPVTTDINRLIRLPRSLHGGSGLVVTPLDRDAIETFDPLIDAVPETFKDNEIQIKTDTERRVELDGKRHKIPAGHCSVRESVGVFLMTGGHAEKVPK